MRQMNQVHTSLLRQPAGSDAKCPLIDQTPCNAPQPPGCIGLTPTPFINQYVNKDKESFFFFATVNNFPIGPWGQV